MSSCQEGETSLGRHEIRLVGTNSCDRGVAWRQCGAAERLLQGTVSRKQIAKQNAKREDAWDHNFSDCSTSLPLLWDHNFSDSLRTADCRGVCGRYHRCGSGRTQASMGR